MKNKKPKGFGLTFLKHGIVFQILWLIIAIAGLLWFDSACKNRFESQATKDYYSYKESILQAVKKDPMKKKEAALMLFLPNTSDPRQYEYSTYAASSYIVNQETGKILGLTDRCQDEFVLLYVLRRGRAGERKWISGEVEDFYDEAYYCDKETLKEYLGDLGDRLCAWKAEKGEASDPYLKRTSTLKLEAFYAKDAYFLPGRITVLYQEMNAALIVREEEILGTFTYAPKDPEGYAYFEINEDESYIYGDLSEVYSENPEYRENWTQMRAEALELESGITHNLKNDLYDPYQTSESKEKLWIVPKYRSIAREFLFSDVTGHVYKAVFYFKGNTLKQYENHGLWDKICSLALLWFLCFVGAFLAAEWEYRRKRYAYLTEGYRNLLADSMAHDLKSPLMVISGYAENLKANLQENNLDKSEYYAEKIYENTGYVSTLITKNLEVLKRDHQTIRLEKTSINLKHLFEEAINRHQGELEERKLTVRMEGELTAKGDKDMLEMVAENLTSNCIRYASEGSEIQLSFGKKRIVIQNQTDVPYAGNLKNLWEPFARGEESRTGKGTGLGLAIAASVLDRHSWKYSLKYVKEKKLFVCMIKTK